MKLLCTFDILIGEPIKLYSLVISGLFLSLLHLFMQSLSYSSTETIKKDVRK